MNECFSKGVHAEVRSVGDVGIEHVHDFHQIVLGISGFADYRVDDDLDTVSSAVGCVIPADHSHYFIGHNDSRVLVLNVGKDGAEPAGLSVEQNAPVRGDVFLEAKDGPSDSAEPLDKAKTKETDLGIKANKLFESPHTFEVNSNFRSLYTSCANELDRFPDEQLTRNISKVIMRSVFVRIANIAPQTIHHHRMDIEKLRVWVAQNLAQKITVKCMAAQVFMSTSRFHAYFLSATGKTPHQFVIEIRLQHALERIRSSADTFASIADEAGFSSPGAMTNLFQKNYGCSPMQIRKRYSNTLQF